jgi:hypothetical protein
VKTVWLDIVEVVMEWLLDTDNDRKGFLVKILSILHVQGIDSKVYFKYTYSAPCLFHSELGRQ